MTKRAPREQPRVKLSEQHYRNTQGCIPAHKRKITMHAEAAKFSYTLEQGDEIEYLWCGWIRIGTVMQVVETIYGPVVHLVDVHTHTNRKITGELIQKPGPPAVEKKRGL